MAGKGRAENSSPQQGQNQTPDFQVTGSAGWVVSQWGQGGREVLTRGVILVTLLRLANAGLRQAPPWRGGRNPPRPTCLPT